MGHGRRKKSCKSHRTTTNTSEAIIGGLGTGNGSGSRAHAYSSTTCGLGLIAAAEAVERLEAIGTKSRDVSRTFLRQNARWLVRSRLF